MFLNRVPILIILIICLGTIYMLFNIKNNVMNIRTELSQIQKQIDYELDTIRVLKAEFSYLTSPNRLKKLNNEYLKLSETRVSQMVSDPNFKNNGPYMRKTVSSNAKKTGNIKWRYKKGPEKYVTLVSGKR